MSEPVKRTTISPSGDRERRILVVVDADSSHLYYTSILLQRLEYDIHTTRAAEDALEIVDVAHPALVLTELSLNGMDGAELLRKIKRNPGTYAIPVIILTASRDAAVKESCRRDGCTAFLQKPVDPDALYAAVQKATESTPRKYIRLNTCLNVIVGDDKAAAAFAIDDYITALSENGMFVSTAHPRPAGTRVPVTILLENERINVTGEVLYSFERGKGPMRTPGMGIKFASIQPGDQDLIKSFIRREITKGLTMGHVGGTIL